MYNTKIELKKEAKYLGIILDSKLIFNKHLNSIKRKGYAAIAQLYNLINMKSALSTYNKCIIYKMIIRLLLLYASSIWSNTFKTNLNALELI